MKIKFKKLRDDIITPVRAHYNDAGADIFSPYKKFLTPHETHAFPLGISLELPDGFMCCVYPRSGLTKKGIISQLPPIDSGYTGEIHCLLTNTTDNIYIINKNDKIGQLVITPIILCDFVEDLGEKREKGAFGSTDENKTLSLSRKNSK